MNNVVQFLKLLIRMVAMVELEIKFFNLLTSVNIFLWTYIVIGMLILAGIYFSVKSGFVQIRMFKEMIRLIRSKEKAKEGLSSFQAFCISTASRVGTGNIIGIALAIGAGGPGAVFWMWTFAILGSSSAFIESTLAQIFKIKSKDGFVGGPAYYIEKGLGNKVLAKIFAVSAIGFLGLIVHAILSNSITEALSNAFSIDVKYGTALVIFLSYLGIRGNRSKIGKISEILVPIMATAYILLALFVSAKNISLIPQVLKLILSSAFGLKAFAGATLGKIVMIGIQRGLFSNEAGMGSAPNAAAAADVSHPVKQGLMQSLGVFVDTLLICNATAFMILLSGNLYLDPNLKGVSLVQEALKSQIGSFGSVFIAISIFLFSLSTIYGCYFYGEINVKYLSKKKNSVNIFKFAVIVMILFGGLAKSDMVWTLGDLFMGIMATINLIALAPLGKYAIIALKDYKYQLKLGIDPTFSSESLKGVRGITCWHDDEHNPDSQDKRDKMRA